MRSSPSLPRRLARSGFMVVVGALAGSILVSPESVQAQATRAIRVGPGAAQRDWMTPSVSTRDLDRFAEVLRLTPEQKQAGSLLLEGYQEEHRSVADEGRRTLDDLRAEFEETGDPSVFRSGELQEVMKRLSTRAAELEKRFLDDLRALLDEEQSGRWPAVERMHRRSKLLPTGSLAGESVDLTAVVGDLEIPDPTPPEIAAVLEQYELDLDRALTERDRAREELSKDAPDPSKGFDMAAVERYMTENRKAGVPVRDVNDRYARLVEGSLPEQARADFARRWRNAKFPQVYREPYAQRALAAAEGFADLSEDQTRAISELKTSYLRDLAPANERWAQAIAAAEADGGGDPFMGFMPRSGEGDEPNPAAEASKARRELDRSTLSKLKGLLTPEQQERLPERSEGAEGGPAGFIMSPHRR